MKYRKKYIVAAVLILSTCLFHFTSFALTTEGDGTKENPFTYVDFTGEKNFEDWADGLYFSPDCVYKNLTTDDGKLFRFLPVYDSVKSINVDAGNGKFGSDSVKSVIVNFNDGTIAAGKELLEQDNTKSLYGVIQQLGIPKYENYYPFFYEFDGSKSNKRLFFDSSDPEMKLGTDKSISDEGIRYDDIDGSSIFVVWKDNKTASSWSKETIDNAKMVACIQGMNKTAYLKKFGGDESLPYGTFSAKKELPGAQNVSYSWVVKTNGETKKTSSDLAFYQENIGKDFDGSVLKETISYGPLDAKTKLPLYSLITDDITYTVYSRPVVSKATIE